MRIKRAFLLVAFFATVLTRKVGAKTLFRLLLIAQEE
jgi:hypothetical protein